MQLGLLPLARGSCACRTPSSTCIALCIALLLQVTKLCDLAPGDSVCSVSWSQRGTYLSVGTNTGEVQIWDVVKLKRTRTMTGHRQRVGTQVRPRQGWPACTDSLHRHSDAPGASWLCLNWRFAADAENALPVLFVSLLAAGVEQPHAGEWQPGQVCAAA